jgi:hypothetical protein
MFISTHILFIIKCRSHEGLKIEGMGELCKKVSQGSDKFGSVHPLTFATPVLTSFLRSSKKFCMDIICQSISSNEIDNP